MNRGGLREYERCIDLVHSLLVPPTAHGNPEDDHLRRKRLTQMGRQFS